MLTTEGLEKLPVSALAPAAATSMSRLTAASEGRYRRTVPLLRLRARGIDHPPLMGADTNRPVTLLDLDLESQLAPIDDLLELRVGGAGLPLGRRGDVLDADLESDGRVALIEFLEGERRRVRLDHPDHPRGGEDARTDRPADVGQKPTLDGEVHRPLGTGLERHQPTIPIPPETPM